MVDFPSLSTFFATKTRPPAHAKAVAPPALTLCDLPSDVLTTIYQGLNSKDRAAWSLIGRQYRDIANALQQNLRIKEVESKSTFQVGLRWLQGRTYDLQRTLERFPNLEQLDLSRCRNLQDSDLKIVGKAANLKDLRLHFGPDISDTGIAHLNACEKLEQLALSYCPEIRGPGLNELSKLSKLRRLGLAGCSSLSDVDFSHFTALEALYLAGCRALSSTSLASLGELTHLKDLHLGGCSQFSDEDFACLRNLTSLQSLILSGRRGYAIPGLLTCQGLSHLRNLKDLRRLYIDNTRIDDEGMAMLKPLTLLRSLNLSSCSRITDDAGPHIAALTNLETLDISYCSERVTEAIFEHLQLLPKLQTLDTDGTVRPLPWA